MSPSKTEEAARTLVSELVMMRAAEAKAFLLVEGSTDRQVFLNFIDASTCEIFDARGKEIALATLALSRRLGISGIICIVDNDFDCFLQIEYNEPDLISNDDHDLEITLVKSMAFDKLLRELGSEDKIARYPNPRIVIQNPAHLYGIVRLFSIKHGLNLKFEGLRYRSVARDLTTDPKAVVKEVLDLSMRHDLNSDDVLRFISEWSGTEHDRWLMCCGHDVTAVISRALQSVLGSQSASSVNSENIERFLRLAFSAEDVLQTSLYTKIKEWERQNPSFKVLRL